MQPVMNECPRCGGAGRLIPAGTSKRTGRPYDAFWACGGRNGKRPCYEYREGEKRDLTWKSDRQWTFLHERHQEQLEQLKQRRSG